MLRSTCPLADWFGQAEFRSVEKRGRSCCEVVLRAIRTARGIQLRSMHGNPCAVSGLIACGRQVPLFFQKVYCKKHYKIVPGKVSKNQVKIFISKFQAFVAKFEDSWRPAKSSCRWTVKNTNICSSRSPKTILSRIKNDINEQVLKESRQNIIQSAEYHISLYIFSKFVGFHRGFELMKCLGFRNGECNVGEWIFIGIAVFHVICNLWNSFPSLLNHRDFSIQKCLSPIRVETGKWLNS